MEDLETSYRKEKEAKRKTKRVSMRKVKNLLQILLIMVMAAVIVLLIAGLINEKHKNNETENQYEGMVILTEEQYEQALLNSRQEGEAKGAEDFRNDIKAQCESGSSSMVKLLRKWYPEYVVYNTKDGYVFADIAENFPANDIDNTGLVKQENGDMEYFIGDEKVSKKGIDVSKYQGEIDWKKVAATDIDYAIIRVGIRGYGSGKLVVDETLEDNLKGARQARIPMGVYFATQAVSVEEAKEEAELVLESIKGYKLEYPVCIDVEEVADSEARTANLTKEERTEYVITFLETIKEAGYDVMIYGNLKSFCGMMDITKLEEYPLWFAYYDSEIYFPYRIDMWQYSEKGKIDGIKEEVDLNIYFR